MPFDIDSKKQVLPTQKTLMAWSAIVLFFLITLLCTVSGLGRFLNLAFPLGALAIAISLYLRYPILYVGFVWWLWFLTPLLRRLADYNSAFTEPSPMLLAPYLATLVTFATLLRYLPIAFKKDGYPFILTSVGIFYGFLIGLIKIPPFTVAIAALDWVVPILLGFHLFHNWKNYPDYRQNTQRVFVWAVLVMGAYGVIQYLFVPDWDAFWLIKSNFTSAGKPEPLGVRIWSTLNSPGPFANSMKSCLIVLFSVKSPIVLPANIFGYLSFLIASVRSAWGGWLVALFVYSISLKPKQQVRLFLAIGILTALFIPIITMGPFSEVVLSRFQTFSDLENDGSANVRKQYFQILVIPALTSFIGNGIGDKFYDWGIFTFLFNLGWIGTIFYLGGMLPLVVHLFKGGQTNGTKSDVFFHCSRAIVISSLAQLPLGTTMTGLLGVFLWSFLGLGIAAQKYHQSQHPGIQQTQ